MDRKGSHQRTILLAGILGLALVGCAQTRVVPSLGAGIDLFESLPSKGIRISLAPRLRQVQTVPATWTSAVFTLASSSVLVGSRSLTIPKSGNFNDTGPGTAATSGTTLFSTVRPGDYILYASTYNATVRNSLGYSAVTLSANTAANVTLTLSTLPEWTAGTLANAAGTQTTDYGVDGGDGGTPASASLSLPKGISFDSAGRMFVADSGNHRIRMINAAQTAISLVAGDGTTGVLNAPSALAYDSLHDVLLIADAGNNRIRLVSAPGTAPALSGTTIALAATPTALAFDATRDSLYVALSNHTVVEVTTPATVAGAPTVILGTGVAGDTMTTGTGMAVQINTPNGLALNDSCSYLYVSDAGNHRIRRVTLAGLSTSIVAGSGTSGNSGDGALAASASIGTPADLAYDTTDSGRLYILDTANYVVRAMTVANGMMATVFGTGSSAYAGNAGSTQAASLFAPSGLGFYQSTGALCVSESGAAGHRIRRGL